MVSRYSFLYLSLRHNPALRSIPNRDGRSPALIKISSKFQSVPAFLSAKLSCAYFFSKLLMINQSKLSIKITRLSNASIPLFKTSKCNVLWNNEFTWNHKQPLSKYLYFINAYLLFNIFVNVIICNELDTNLNLEYFS